MWKTASYPYEQVYFESGHCFIYLKWFKKSLKIHEYTLKFVE